MQEFDVGDVRPFWENVQRPEVSTEAPQVVQYDVKLARHHDPCALRSVYFCSTPSML